MKILVGAVVGVLLVGVGGLSVTHARVAAPAVTCVESNDANFCLCKDGADVCAGEHAVAACAPRHEGGTCCASPVGFCYCSDESKCDAADDRVVSRCGP